LQFLILTDYLITGKKQIHWANKNNTSFFKFSTSTFSNDYSLASPEDQKLEKSTGRLFDCFGAFFVKT
jgi:hypothetical protein